MYEPENALATLPVPLTVLLGCHFGRLTKLLGAPRAVAAHWAALSAALVAAAAALVAAGVPLNKQLWSPSYLLFTAGAAGFTLAAAFLLVDAPGTLLSARASARARRWLRPCEVMGMNAILVFAWHGPAQHLVDAFYYAAPVAEGSGGQQFDRSPAEGALLGGGGRLMVGVLLPLCGGDHRAAQLVYVLLKIAGFAAAAWACAKRGYFWKL